MPGDIVDWENQPVARGGDLLGACGRVGIAVLDESPGASTSPASLSGHLPWFTRPITGLQGAAFGVCVTGTEKHGHRNTGDGTFIHQYSIHRLANAAIKPSGEPFAGRDPGIAGRCKNVRLVDPELGVGVLAPDWEPHVQAILLGRDCNKNTTAAEGLHVT